MILVNSVSVSRKFSLKFHAFFHTVIMKGAVLGTVDHFYWKKEYQARGAPHYHILLWIRDAPVIGQDDPDEVLSWIQKRITCHIPDEKLILTYTDWSLDNKCTNAVHIANENVNVAVLSLPDADLGSLARCVKAL